MRWRKYIDFDVIHLLVGAIVGVGLSSCQPEMPVISTITVEADGLTVPVNPDLYGLTIEEINHGIDGGLYAELIQNRSFEDGVPPLNCPYDAARNVLITPNGGRSLSCGEIPYRDGGGSSLIHRYTRI